MFEMYFFDLLDTSHPLDDIQTFVEQMRSINDLTLEIAEQLVFPDIPF